MLLGFFRTILKGYFMTHVKESNDVHVLLTKPKSIDYEIFVFQHYLGFMQYLLAIKEKEATLE